VLREHLQGTEEACIEAERQLEEVERRLKSLDEEIRELQRVIAQRGERDRDKIIANAKATAEHILEKAKLEAGYRVRQARRRLRLEVVDVAISLTEESIRKAIDSRDQQRLVEEYLKDLRQMPRLTA
jgi:F-type H+-transporting ATPase subunit b